MVLEPVTRPLQVRLLDAGDRALRRLGVRRHRFDPEALKAAAAKSVGLSDYGPPDFEEGLRMACESAEDPDARLDIVGRAVVEATLKRILTNRLLWWNAKKTRPEVFEQPLIAPLVVVGLPRTGTTALHRLLSYDPHGYAPPTWEVWRPLPRPQGPDGRRDVAVKAIAGLRQLAPQLDAKHYLDADATEECWHLRDPSFRGVGPYHLWPAMTYYDWLGTQDVGPSFAMYRDFLQLLQAAHPGKRLTLKAPSHAPHVADYEAAVPEAMFVQTHRDPVELAGSMVSLAITMMQTVAPRVDVQRVGRWSFRMLTDWVAANLEQRERLKRPIVDVRYDDFVKDPVGTVRRVYEHHGLPFTDEVERAIRAGAAERPQNAHGKHVWDLGEMGLSEGEIREVFAAYASRFLA